MAVKQTFVDHQSCSSVTLFSRLEGKDDATCNAVSMHGEEARGPDEHRGVAIMPTGMHCSFYF